MAARRLSRIQRVCGVIVFAAFLAGPAGAQGDKSKLPPDVAAYRDVTAYREFLSQARYALTKNDGGDSARTILDLCAKEQRSFEWHYLFARAKYASRVFKEGDQDTVHSAAYSPDGKTIATANDNRSIKLWDAATGKVRLTLTEGRAEVQRVVFHPLGKLLASSDNDDTIKLWNVTTGAIKATLKVPERVYFMAFSPDGAWLAALDWEGGVNIVDVAKEKVSTIYRKKGGDTYAVAFSPDGQHLAFGYSLDNRAHTIHLWTVPDFLPHRELTWHNQRVTGLAFPPTGMQLYSCSKDGIAIFDMVSGKLTRAIAPESPEVAPLAIALNRRGNVLAVTGWDGKARIWHEPFTKPDLHIDIPRRYLRRSPIVSFSPDSRTLLLDAREGVQTHDIAGEADLIGTGQPVWSVHAAKDEVLVSMRQGIDGFSANVAHWRRALHGHVGSVRAVCLQPEGHLLASAGADRIIKIRDGRGGQLHHDLRGHTGLIRALAFAPDGKHLASASDDRTLRIWDAVAGQEVRVLRGHEVMATGVHFLPGTDQLVSSGGDGALKVWNWRTGKEVKSWQAHQGIVSHLALTADGTRVATAGADDKVKIWDVKTRQLLHAFDDLASMVHGLAFSPDGKRLAIGGPRLVTLWDTGAGQHVFMFDRVAGPINAIAFSPDGTRLFSGTYDGNVMMWRARPD